MRKKILRFIEEHWSDTTRLNHKNIGTLVGLPYPYTIPCVDDAFQEFYYWDTYFSCRGLIRQGFIEQAKNNCDNLIYLVENYGFVPNGNRTYYLNRSQPPYMGLLIKHVYDRLGDKHWLNSAVGTMEKEYEFWMNNRMTLIGLNHYGNHADRNDLLQFYDDSCVPRLRMRHYKKEDRLRESSQTLAEAESGWDFNPRFRRRCLDFAPIDLNSNLYKYELLLTEFYKVLGDEITALKWLGKSKMRKDLINRYCWHQESGAFMDYDFINNCHSTVISAAILHPLWCGLASDEQASCVVHVMETTLETEFGLLACQFNTNGFNYQWDYPYGWAPLHLITIEALKDYGFRKTACRIAEKYVSTVCRVFENTGTLWGKYNVVNGNIDINCEGTNRMPAMMGWTAGVFVEACNFLEENC